MHDARRRLTTAVTGLAVLLLGCSEDVTTSAGNGSTSGSVVPYLTIGGGADENGQFARRTPDGGYLIVGEIGKLDQYFSDLYAVRTDATGAILGHYPVRRGETHAQIYASVLTADGGIVTITIRDNDAMLVKFASDGSVVWERNLGLYAATPWFSLCTAGDGFLITVVPDIFADLNAVELILTNADCTVWTKAAWAAGTRRVFCAAEAEDGSFVLAGAERTAESGDDILVVRTEPGSVTEDWAKTIGGQDHDNATLVVALDNDAVLFGTMDDPPGPLERGHVFLMRLRRDGREAWTRDISALGYISSMTPTSDGGLAVAAHSSTDGAKIARLNGTGSVVWERKVGTGSDNGALLSIAADAEGYVLTGGTGRGQSTDSDILLARTDKNGNGYSFPPHETGCIDPVTPPDPNDVVGTQRSYSVVHDTGRGMHAIWALSSDFVVAVGDSGTIACFDGTSWSQMTSNTTEQLYDVFGFAEDDVLVAARYGKIFHYDGLSWTEMPSTATYLIALWGAAPDDVWAGGVQLMHYDGARWTDATPKGWRTPIDMDGITATDIYSVGAAGKVQHFDGCTWSTVFEAPDRLYGVSAIPGPLVVLRG